MDILNTACMNMSKKAYEYFNKKLGSHECQKIATRAFQ